jgi:hypothetical protein
MHPITVFTRLCPVCEKRFEAPTPKDLRAVMDDHARQHPRTEPVPLRLVHRDVA